MKVKVNSSLMTTDLVEMRQTCKNWPTSLDPTKAVLAENSVAKTVRNFERFKAPIKLDFKLEESKQSINRKNGSVFTRPIKVVR